MIIEISTHGSALKRNHDSFLIQNSDGKTEIPAEKVDAIIISSNSLISTQAIKLCLEKQIQLVLTEYSGKPIARLWSSTPGKTTQIRRNQYLNADTNIAFIICKYILITKLKRQRKLLIDLKNNRKRKTIEMESAILSIGTSLKKASHLQMTPNFKEVFLGLEGSSAAQYFSAISSILPKRWVFKERSQHPALDEFNAVLNYVYGMGYFSIEKIIILSGLDPNAGFYHTDSYGKPTLAFDLIELSRPLIDRMVITNFTKRKVKENWFEKQADSSVGVFLSRVARQSLISSYVENVQKKVESEAWIFCRKIIQQLGGTQNEKKYVLCSI